MTSWLHLNQRGISILHAQEGVNATVGDRSACVRRTSFGPRMRDRAFEVDKESGPWRVLPASLRSYSIIDSGSNVILKCRHGSLQVAPVLTNEDLTLALLVHVSQLVLRSSVLWLLSQSL